MFPQQTSFIPISVAITRWVEANGFGGLYPYWYLGTTPVKYLIGPVVPTISIFLHKLAPGFSLFDLSYFTLFTSHLLLSFGWGMLVGRLSGSRMVGWWVGIGVLFAPWHWVSALALSEVSAVFAGALTPWVLLAYSLSARSPVSLRHAGPASSAISTPQSVPDAEIPSSQRTLLAVTRTTGSRKSVSFSRFASQIRVLFRGFTIAEWLPSLSFALLLLTNSTAAIPAIVGLFILGMVFSKNWGEGIKRVFFVIAAGWVLSTAWYGLGFWLTIFGAPSVGGKSAVMAFVTLLNQMRGFVPVILVIVLVFWKVKPKTFYDRFVLFWLTIFGSLTLFRFMADPKFWMDWTSWMGEVEIGVTLLVAKVLSQLSARGSVSLRHAGPASSAISTPQSVPDAEIPSSQRTLLAVTRTTATPRGVYPERNRRVMFLKWLPSLIPGPIISIFLIYFLVGWFFAWQKRDLWLPRRSVENTVEYQIAKKLEEIVKPGETVFLSGSTAFWLNAFIDVRQVRGGRDEVSRASGWRDVVWEVREGSDPQLAFTALSKLKVDYLVVHGDNSKEYYHDFLYPDKFNKNPNFLKIFDDGQDFIYKL